MEDQSQNTVEKESRPNQESNINFVTMDPMPTIDDPKPEDPMGIYLEGLNFHWDSPRFAKFLNKIEVKHTNCIKKKSDYVGIIFFDNLEDRKSAYEKLVCVRFGEKKLFVVPLFKDRSQSKNMCRRVRARAMNDLSKADINDRVTKWHRIPLNEQYQLKSEKYTTLIKDIIPPGSPNMEIIPVPNTSYYRNKVELTIGRNLEAQVCVGFNLGSKEEDVIAPIDTCVNVPKIAPKIATIFKEFVETSSVPMYDRVMNKGVWKFIVIRTTENGQSMLVVATFGKLPDEEIARLKNTFESVVSSLWYVETKNFESFGKDPVFSLLSGTPSITETLRGLEFDISPMSFFQTNTPGAELLFQKIEEVASVNSKTILVDVCCGTGVIGLALSRHVHKLIGLDIEESAILDAKKNAERNGIQNAEFIAGSAESVLPGILERYNSTEYNVICIVDPPREGLHKKALMALRDCESLKRVVYVSCNPESLVSDAKKHLFNNDMRKSPIFHPKVWFGVDMFPHTDRVELVMLMER